MKMASLTRKKNKNDRR